MNFKAFAVLRRLVFCCLVADLILYSAASIDASPTHIHIDRRRSSQSISANLNPYFIRLNDNPPKVIDLGPNLPTLQPNSSAAWPPKICELNGHRHVIVGNKIYSAGLSEFGQLGNGTIAPGAFEWPVTEVDLSGIDPGPHNWVQITCGINFVIVRDDEDILYGWGLNNNLREGDGTIIPIPLPLNNSDPFQNTSLLQAGEKWIRGANIDGLVGVGYASPNEAAFLNGNYSMISCTQRVCSALDIDLGVVTWGSSGTCLLGDNNPSFHSILQPTPISFPPIGSSLKVKKLISSNVVRAAILDNDDIYWWGQPFLNEPCIPVPTLLPFPSRPRLSNQQPVPILDFRCFDRGLVILMANGDVYGAGSGLSAAAPTLLDLSSAFLNNTFYRHRFIALGASDNSILALVEPRPRSETGCRPPAPSPTFVCVDSVWITENNPSTQVITIPSPTIIIGNLTVNGTITFNPNLGNTNSSVALLDIRGCAIITDGISIQIDQATFDTLSSSVSERTLLLLVQNCPGLIINETETPQVRIVETNLKKSCKRVGVRRNQTIDEDTGKASLNAVLFIDDSRCNHNLWWIITVSVVCAVIVFGVIGFILLATFNSKVKQCVRPFTKRGQVNMDDIIRDTNATNLAGHQIACKCPECANISSLVGQKI